MKNQIFQRAAAAVLTVGLLLGVNGGTVFADIKDTVANAIVLDGKTYGNQGTKPSNNKTTITVPSDKYKTVQSAIDAAKEGTTIVIKGNFEEKLTIKKSGITLKGEGNAKISGNESMEYGDLLTIEGSNIVIEDLEFTGLYLRAPNDKESAGGIRVKPGSSNVYILNCKIHDLGCIYNYTDASKRKKFNGHGISVKGSESKKTSNITISGCEVYNLTTGRSECVVLNNNTEYFTLSNNYIHDNDNIGIDCAGGYGGGYSTDYTRNGEICGNVVKKISSLLFKNPGYIDDKGKPHAGSDGIYVDGGRDIYIHDNYVTECDIGLEIAAENKDWVVSGVIAERNLLVYNDQYVGLAIGGSDTSCGVAMNNIVRYNTVINSGEQHCLVVKVSSDNEITNNIFISDDNPRNKSDYYSSNNVTNNASNRASDLPGTNTKIALTGINVDFDTKKVEIVTKTDISKFGYDGVDESGTVTPPEQIETPTTDKKDEEKKETNPTGTPVDNKPTDNKPSDSNPTDNKSDDKKQGSSTPATTSTTPSSSEKTVDKTKAFVEKLYTEVLGREKDEDGANYWYEQLYNFKASGADVGLMFVCSEEFSKRKVSDDEFLKIMYKTFFSREPDQSGFDYWKKTLSSGTTRNDVARSFVYSQEWADTCAEFGIRSGGTLKSNVKIAPTDKTYSFVERMYTTALGRTYDTEGRQYWAELLSNFDVTGESVGAFFFLSDEMNGYGLSNKDYVNRLYLTFMDREADDKGLSYWVDLLDKGHTRKDIVYGFTRSEEFESKCIDARILPN